MRRRALMAASQPTFNGNELPTELPGVSAADEERANLYDFLNSLTINGREVLAINKYNGYFKIGSSSRIFNLYSDGSVGSAAGGGGSD